MEPLTSVLLIVPVLITLYVFFTYLNNKYKLYNILFFCPTCFSFAVTWNISYWLIGIPSELLCGFIGLSFTGSWYQFCHFFAREKKFSFGLRYGDLLTVLWFYVFFMSIILSVMLDLWTTKLLILCFDVLMFIILTISFFKVDEFNKFKFDKEWEDYINSKK